MDVREIDDRYPEYAKPYEPTGTGRHHGALPWGLVAGLLTILLPALLYRAPEPIPAPAPAPAPPIVVPVPEPTPVPPDEPITPPDIPDTPVPPDEPIIPPFIPDDPPTPPPTPPETVRYTVTFVNWDGTVLSSRQYDEGTAASAVVRPATPTRPSDGSFTYTFSGWSPDIRAVTGNITYTAQYSATPVALRHTVTFVDWDGTVLSSRQYDEGTAVSGIAVPADPTRPSDGSFRYIFYGWTPELAPVTADATYTAVYLTQELPHYDITFVDWDGTILQATASYAEDTPVSDIAVPADPTRTDTTEYTYTFAGWDPPLGPVTGDATYTATYTETPRTYTAPTIGLVQELDYFEDSDEYFVGFTATIELNDVAGSTGQLKLMHYDAKAGAWESAEFGDEETFGDAVVVLYATKDGARTQLTPSDLNASYDIPEDADGLEADIVWHIPWYVDDEYNYAYRVREVMNVAFDYTLPNGETGTVQLSDDFYLYRDWFFGIIPDPELDTAAKTITLYYPYVVDYGGPLDYDSIYWHPHLYWQDADGYSWSATGTELDITPTITQVEIDGVVTAKLVYQLDTLVAGRAYDFQAQVIYSDYGVDDADHWDNWVISVDERKMEFEEPAHTAPTIGIYTSAEYGGDSSDWHFGIGAVGCEEIPDDLKGGRARLKFERYDEDAGAWVDIEFISAADWEANDAKPWSDPTKEEIGDRQMFFGDTVNIGVKDGSSTSVSTLADPTAMIELGDSDYIIASMMYHLPLNHTWEPASTLIRPVMDYEYPDGVTGTVEGNPIRVYSGSFIGANGAVADAEAKTITLDFIYDGGPYTIDPDNVNWGHSLHWQDVSDGSYSSDRYKDEPDGTHGWVAAEPTMETYAGADGKTHVRVTYTLDEVNADYAYDYIGTAYYHPEAGGESGMWEAFPTQNYIRFT